MSLGEVDYTAHNNEAKKPNVLSLHFRVQKKGGVADTKMEKNTK
jgi:hypothetical protein